LIQEHERLKVEIRLFANLAKLLPPGSQKKRATMTIRKGMTVDELLGKLSLPKKVTNIVMINGALGDRETELKEGDVVSVFPPIAGG
jgi:molybdopterin synthase sulfur carrier subunit